MFLFLKKVYEKTVHVLETINVNKWMKLYLTAKRKLERLQFLNSSSFVKI